MKVTEIISEAGGKAGVVSTLIGAAGKALGSSRGRLINQAVERLSKGGEWAGKLSRGEVEAYLSRMGRKANDMIRNDPSIVDDVLKSVNRSRGITASIGALKGGFSSLISFLTKLGFAAEAGSAVWNYYSRMSDAEANLNSGAWSQSNYDAVRQQEMSVLITKLAAAIPAMTLGGTGAIIGLFGKLPVVGPIAKMLQGASKATQLGYLAFLNSDAGKEILAKLAVLHIRDIPVLGPIAEMMGISGDTSQIIGASGVKLLDMLEAPFYKLAGKQPPATTVGVPEPGTAAGVGQTSPAGAADEYVPTAARATNVAGWR